ncbi:MAG: PfkB family carbohydrate kinase [bacterium]
MILTVTLNPLLEKRLFFNNFLIDSSNRSYKEEFRSGGKGINVSRQLNFLNINNQALTFLGGQTGKILRSIYHQEKLNYFAVSTKASTREAVLAIDENVNKITTLFPPNPILTETEAKEFAAKMEKMISNCSVVVFSGSSPCKETDFIFPYGIELANKYDKVSIIDTYGTSLGNCIKKGPTVLHNNIDEISRSLNLDLQDENSKIKLLDDLYNKGVKLVFLTDGKNDTYCSKFNFHYKIISPKISVIDATGSGDCFVAGLAYGLEKDLVFDEFIKIAASLGVVNASSWQTCSFELKEIENVIEKIVVKTVGKKMKLIDDSPTI